MGVVEGPGLIPRKKSFCPQNNKKSGCIFTQLLTGGKDGQSPEALGHGFYGSIAKRSLQKQYKSYSKKLGQTEGNGLTIARP